MLLFVRANILYIQCDRENQYFSLITIFIKEDVCVTPFCYEVNLQLRSTSQGEHLINGFVMDYTAGVPVIYLQKKLTEKFIK